MNSIEQSELNKYTAIWENPLYGSACHSLNLWHNRREIFPNKFDSAIDLGCGPGLLLNTWNAMGVDCLGIDIAPNCLHPVVPKDLFYQACLWNMDLGREFDLGVCCDVMEHIPPGFVAQTLSNISKHCKFVIFKIAHTKDVCGNGTLHLTVEDENWWHNMMKQHMTGLVNHLGWISRSGYQDSIWRFQR